MKQVGWAALLAVVLSGSALAQGDARFCGAYALNISGVGDLAIKKNPACLDYAKGVHGNYQSHFDWCMRQPPAEVQGAEANIRRLVERCTGNASGPAPTSPPPRQAGSGGGLRWIASSQTRWNPQTARVEPDPMKVDDTAMSVWVCRAPYRGSLAPGWHGIANGCMIEFGGGSISVDAYELALGRPLWMWATAPGAIPEHAVAGGAEADGQPLYICRAQVGQQKVVGKVRPGFRGCNLSTPDRRAQTVPTYEVLVSRY